MFAARIARMTIVFVQLSVNKKNVIIIDAKRTIVYMTSQ